MLFQFHCLQYLLYFKLIICGNITHVSAGRTSQFVIWTEGNISILRVTELTRQYPASSPAPPEYLNFNCPSRIWKCLTMVNKRRIWEGNVNRISQWTSSKNDTNVWWILIKFLTVCNLKTISALCILITLITILLVPQNYK